MPNTLTKLHRDSSNKSQEKEITFAVAIVNVVANNVNLAISLVITVVRNIGIVAIKTVSGHATAQ